MWQNKNQTRGKCNLKPILGFHKIEGKKNWKKKKTRKNVKMKKNKKNYKFKVNKLFFMIFQIDLIYFLILYKN